MEKSKDLIIVAPREIMDSLDYSFHELVQQMGFGEWYFSPKIDERPNFPADAVIVILNALAQTESPNEETPTAQLDLDENLQTISTALSEIPGISYSFTSFGEYKAARIN